MYSLNSAIPNIYAFRNRYKSIIAYIFFSVPGGFINQSTLKYKLTGIIAINNPMQKNHKKIQTKNKAIIEMIIFQKFGSKFNISKSQELVTL